MTSAAVKLTKWPLQLLHHTALITHYPNVARRCLSCVAALVAEGIYNQMPVPANIPGSNNLGNMSPMSTGGQRMDCNHGSFGWEHLLPPAWPSFDCKSLNNSLLFALVASHAAVPLFFDQRLFAEGQRQRLER